jgi:hypothetical protein
MVIGSFGQLIDHFRGLVRLETQHDAPAHRGVSPRDGASGPYRSHRLDDLRGTGEIYPGEQLGEALCVELVHGRGRRRQVHVVATGRGEVQIVPVHGPPCEPLTEPPRSEATPHCRTADVDGRHFQPTVGQSGDHDVCYP